MEMARRYCGEKYPRGDLSEIDTTEKLNIAKQLYIDLYGGKYTVNF